MGRRPKLQVVLMPTGYRRATRAEAVSLRYEF